MSNENELIANWWGAFVNQSQNISALFSRKTEWDLGEWMHKHLHAIHPSLMWEYGPAVNCDGHRLVITPESRQDLRPLVRKIVREAPVLDEWEFYEYRLPEDYDRAVDSVEARTKGRINDLQVIVQQGEHNKIDLFFISPRAASEKNQIRHDAFVATETLLGEMWLDRWVGAIEALSKVPPNCETIALPELRTAFAKLIQTIKNSLPNTPRWSRDPENITYSLYKIEPKQQEDYCDMYDIFTWVTSETEIFQAIRSNGLFFDERFSQFNEVFCYLKIDGSLGLDGTNFESRSEIEDAIDGVIRSTKLGAVLGGGQGLRYCYIQLALSDEQKAWSEIQAVLQNANVGQRTWLLYHDAYRVSEWRGLYEDSPAPPMPDFDSKD